MKYKLESLSSRQATLDGESLPIIDLYYDDDRNLTILAYSDTELQEFTWKNKEWSNDAGLEPGSAPKYWTEAHWVLVDKTVEAMSNFDKTYNQGE